MTPADNSFQPLLQVARVLTWGAFALLAYGVGAWTVSQPWFALRTIDVVTPAAHVTETQVRLVVERHVRGTFFTVDLERVREALEKLPWVREAKVARHWPDTLVVSLTEHKPLARWNQDALVNDQGEVFAGRAWRLRLDNGMQIVLGRDEPVLRLARFTALYPRLFAAPATAPAYVDLRYVDGFAIRMPDNTRPFSLSES
jgi:cell division protein FtsQ